jgi:hypothetical protein
MIHIKDNIFHIMNKIIYVLLKNKINLLHMIRLKTKTNYLIKSDTLDTLVQKEYFAISNHKYDFNQVFFKLHTKVSS